MNIFEKELECLCLIQEDAEEKIVADFYLEAVKVEEPAKSSGRITSLIEKAKTAIRNLIQKFKDFINKLKMKYGAKKFELEFQNRQNVKIRMTLDRGQYEKFMMELKKLMQENIDDIKKIEKLWGSYKIDAIEAKKRIDAANNKFADKLEKLARKKPVLKKGEASTKYSTLKELIKDAKALQKLQSDLLDELNNNIDSELSRISEEVDRLRRDGKDAPATTSFKLNIANVFSKNAREITRKVVDTFNILAVISAIGAVTNDVKD